MVMVRTDRCGVGSRNVGEFVLAAVRVRVRVSVRVRGVCICCGVIVSIV